MVKAAVVGDSEAILRKITSLKQRAFGAASPWPSCPAALAATACPWGGAAWVVRAAVSAVWLRVPCVCLVRMLLVCDVCVSELTCHSSPGLCDRLAPVLRLGFERLGLRPTLAGAIVE